MSDIEEAIDATGFGLFNVLLLIFTFFGLSATIFETASMSYYITSAECVLKLDLYRIGLLHSAVFGGMIVSSIPWGYYSDLKGRKPIFVIGFLSDAIIVMASSFCSSIWCLLILKFLGGFCVCGTFSTLMAYVSEIHGKKVRHVVMIITGLMITLSTLMLSLIALVVMRRPWHIDIGPLTYNSWQVFLLVCSLPSVICFFGSLFFPESPRFLFNNGQNKKAFEILKKIHACNHFKTKDYPISDQQTEMVKSEDTNKETHLQLVVKEFKNNYIQLTVLVCAISFCIQMAQNTLRLWLPKIFSSVVEMMYKTHENQTLCDIIKFSVVRSKSMNLGKNCIVYTTASSFTSNFIVGGCGLLGFIVAAVVINYIGGKLLLIIALGTATVSANFFYVSSSTESIIAIAAIYTTGINLSSTSMINNSVHLYPTLLRTLIVSLMMTIGRLGSLLGNVVFPALMSKGCLPPFIFLGTICVVSFVLSFFLRNPKQVAFH